MSHFQRPITLILPLCLIGIQFLISQGSVFSAENVLSNLQATGTVTADFELDGSGSDVDSIAFWETTDPYDMLLFTSAKASQLVEVWQYPFAGNEQTPLTHGTFGSSGTRVNGVVIDQDSDLLYVSVSNPQSTVSVFSLPDQIFAGEFISGTHDLKSEPNLDLLSHSNGETWAYVSADQTLYIYNAVTGNYVSQFQPEKGLETVLADDLHQIIYVPDEKDRTGIYAYHPDGTPYLNGGSNQFGSAVFQSDAEGITLYRCPAYGQDNGTGFIIVSDQLTPQTEFEFFDRQTWEHLGTLLIDGVSNTDGIASTQQPLPDYPLGLFAAINDDISTVGVGWDKVLAAMGLSCDDFLDQQVLSLNAGWNIVSTYIHPADPDLDVILAPIHDQLVLFKNGYGQIYWPAYGVDQVNTWNIVEGYELYMLSSQNLTIGGIEADPNTLSADLGSSWNLAGYWSASSMNTNAAWASLGSNLTLAKNGSGELYWPDMGIDEIISLQPGHGYQIKMNTAANLSYPPPVP